MIVYRLALQEDIEQLVPMALDFFTVSGVEEFGATFNYAHVHGMLTAMTTNPDSVVLIAANDGLVYGAIGAHLSHHIMNRHNGLVLELFQWVRPEARGHHVGSGLLKCLEDWAKSKGAVTIAMMSMHEIDSPAGQQFKKHGYMATEQIWMKKL